MKADGEDVELDREDDLDCEGDKDEKEMSTRSPLKGIRKGDGQDV